MRRKHANLIVVLNIKLVSVLHSSYTHVHTKKEKEEEERETSSSISILKNMLFSRFEPKHPGKAKLNYQSRSSRNTPASLYQLCNKSQSIIYQKFETLEERFKELCIC